MAMCYACVNNFPTCDFPNTPCNGIIVTSQLLVASAQKRKWTKWQDTLNRSLAANMLWNLKMSKKEKRKTTSRKPRWKEPLIHLPVPQAYMKPNRYKEKQT
ncbi:hypothetical protein LSAT2_031364 [Lamellibrachia satsuma]|nr:hypothetical protein LSAT2_031364 [Lamellibrachia satsuma]